MSMNTYDDITELGDTCEYLGTSSLHYGIIPACLPATYACRHLAMFKRHARLPCFADCLVVLSPGMISAIFARTRERIC